MTALMGGGQAISTQHVWGEEKQARGKKG